jgi:2-dehydro-3-deoxyphosphogluconate aldolase/(4S)-4-hydroxy-2-oxoglutarate aldolase
MTKTEVLKKMRTTGLLPVLRAPSADLGYALAEAIVAGGVDVLEITMTVPGATALIERVRNAMPHVLVGAGSVLDAETARACFDVGAEFIVSPATNMETIEFCRRSEKAVLPGALTPTEIVTAWRAGADVIKVFPASAVGGAKYLRSIKAPLPQIELIPTGGVSLETAMDFLEAGAFALGVGADLVDTEAIAAGRPEQITAHARRYMEIVQRFSSAPGRKYR